MAAPIGQLVVEISTDAQAFTQGLDRARGDFNRFSTTLKQGATESSQQLQRIGTASNEGARGIAEAAKSVKIMAAGLANELNPVLGNIVIGVSQATTHFKSFGLGATGVAVALAIATAGITSYIRSVLDAGKAQAEFNLALRSGDIGGLQGQLKAATKDLLEYEANSKTIIGRIRNLFTDIGIALGGRSPAQEATRARGGIEQLTGAEQRRESAQATIQLFQAQMAETEQFIQRAFNANDLVDFERGLSAIGIALDRIADNKRIVAEITRDLALMEAQTLQMGPGAVERINARFEAALQTIQAERDAAQLALRTRREQQGAELRIRRRDITDPELRGAGPEGDIFTSEMATAMQAARLKALTDYRIALNQIDDVAKNLGRDFDRVGAEIDATATALKKLGEQGVTAGAEVDELKDRLFRLTTTRNALNDIFAGLDTAIAGTIQGILQGTQTIGQAFANMGRSIAASLIEQVIKRGLNVVQKALEDFLAEAEKSGLIQTLLKIGTGLVGAFTGAGAPAAAAATGEIPYYLAAPPTYTAFQHGGIVTRPTMGLVGEAGPEAIVPLSGGARGPLVQVNITNRHPAAEIQQSTRRGANGSEIHDIVVMEVRRMVGSGEMDNVMAPYALRRVPTQR